MIQNVTQLILMALILSSQVFAGDLISAKAFSRMKKAISEKTDNAWDIVLKDTSIEFTFKKAFKGTRKNRFPCGPDHNPKMVKYQFCLLKADYVDPKIHDQEKRSTQSNFGQTEEKVFTSIKHTRNPRGAKPSTPTYTFYPENDVQKALLKAFRALKNKMFYWPDVYFDNNGYRYLRRYDFKPESAKDSVVYEAARRSKNIIFSVIKWYEEQKLLKHTEPNQILHQTAENE